MPLFVTQGTHRTRAKQWFPGKSVEGVFDAEHPCECGLAIPHCHASWTEPVAPGDWIVKLPHGHVACRDKAFRETYEPVGTWAGLDGKGWSYERPEVAGWYWWQGSETDKPTIIQLVWDGDHWVWHYEACTSDLPMAGLPTGRFIGPIVMPNRLEPWPSSPGTGDPEAIHGAWPLLPGPQPAEGGRPMTEIKPCPACGGPATCRDLAGSGHWMAGIWNEFKVICGGCGVCGPRSRYEADAIAAWNALPRRPLTEPPASRTPSEA